ncbi:MAG: hypothetical protein ACFE9W_08460, partial [Promethearchaeota archaeon]
LFALLGIGGFFWAMINVNSIVIVWELVGKSRLGAGTGMYYAFSMSAAILGPVITGVVFDLTSVALLFPVSIGFLIIALILTLAIKTGEVGDEQVSELAA